MVLHVHVVRHWTSVFVHQRCFVLVLWLRSVSPASTSTAYHVQLQGGIVSGVSPVVHCQCAVLRTASGCSVPYEQDGRPFPLAATTSFRMGALASIVDHESHRYSLWLLESLPRLLYVMRAAVRVRAGLMG